MEFVVFEEAAEYVQPDVNLIFARLIERNVLDRHNAEIFCSLQKDNIAQLLDIDEMRVPFMLQYTQPLITGTTTPIHITISAFSPPYGIGCGIDVYGFIADPMKPSPYNITPYKSPAARYKPYIGTTYTLAAMPILVQFILHRMTSIDKTIGLDYNLAQGIAASPIITPSIKLPPANISPAAAITNKRLADIREANLAYNTHEIKMQVLISHARQKYNKDWSALTEHAKNEIMFELTKRDEQLRRQRENNCGHKPLLASLIMCVDRSKRAGARIDLVQTAYAELAKYSAASKTPDGYITCANCTFPIMCPHYDMYCRTLSMNVVAKYFGTDDNYTFHCRICGEYLMYSAELSENLDIASRQGYLIGDDITKLITKTCSFMIFQYLLMPRRNFAEILSTCTDFTILKIRRRITGKFIRFFNVDKIDKYTQTIVAIYCVGFITRLLMQFDDIQLRATLDIPDTNKGRLVGYLQYFYSILSRLYNQQILAVMTLEEFGQLLYDAYKVLNMPILITDITRDATEYDTMGICHYISSVTGTKVMTLAQAHTHLANLRNPYIDRIRRPVTVDDYGVYNGVITPYKGQVYIFAAHNSYKNEHRVMSGAVFDTMGRPHMWVMGVCQICGAAYADVCDTNVDVAVHAAGLAESFYNAFAINCPEGDQHTGTPCDKCGMTDTYDIGIITKYSGKYHDMMSTELVPMHVVPAREYTQPKWAINKYIIGEFEKLYAVPITRIRNLGLLGGILLRNIESGDATPWQNPDNNRTQGNVLFQYSVILNAAYSSLRQASHDAPPGIRLMINAHPDDVATLPDLPVANYAEYASLDDAEYANYMFVYFLGTLIWFNKPGLLKLFGRYFVAYILDYDAMFAKTDLQVPEYADFDDYDAVDEPEDMFDDIDSEDMKTNVTYA